MNLVIKISVIIFCVIFVLTLSFLMLKYNLIGEQTQTIKCNGQTYKINNTIFIKEAIEKYCPSPIIENKSYFNPVNMKS